MPKFLVTKKHDAWVLYRAIIEADDVEAAIDEANRYEVRTSDIWRATGEVEEFDHCEVQEDGAELITDDADCWIEDMTKIAVSAQEHATILAALRFYQEKGMGEPANRSDAIHEIATNGDTVTSLDGEGIDALCERINV